MSGEFDSLLREIWEDGPEYPDSHREKYYHRKKYENLIQSMIDIDGQRVWASDIYMTIQHKLLNSRLNGDSFETFREDIVEYFEDLRSGDRIKYTFVFPLNIEPDERFKEYNIGDVEIKNISFNEWQSEFAEPALQEARNNPDRSLDRFLNYCPSSLNFSNTSHSYWKANYYAKDPGYATVSMKNIALIFSGFLNFCSKRWEFSKHQRAKTSPETPFSYLQKPYIYLLYDETGYGEYQPVDRQSRTVENIPENGFFERLAEFSNFNIHDDILAEVGESLKLYQKGIAEPTVDQSFFSFWRGVEYLSQTSSNDSVSESIDRARTALEYVEPEMYDEIIIKDIIDNLRNQRNAFVHHNEDNFVNTQYQVQTKLLLEGLITLYLRSYECGGDMSGVINIITE